VPLILLVHDPVYLELAFSRSLFRENENLENLPAAALALQKALMAHAQLFANHNPSPTYLVQADTISERLGGNLEKVCVAGVLQSKCMHAEDPPAQSKRMRTCF